LALALQLLWGIVFIARAPVTIDGTRYFTLFDDAMISMRYARNLAEGHGLVWNAGEPPVEGYSNFLWTIFMAALHAVAPGRIVPLLVSIAGLALLLVNIAVVWSITRRLAPDLPEAAALAALMVACLYSLGYWTLRGMEVGLLVLLIDAAVLGVLTLDAGGRGTLLALAVTLLPLVRADGIVPALLVGGYGWAFTRPRTSRTWLFVALPIAALAAHTGFRLWYYGEWMPNTYYLKMTGAPLMSRLQRGLQTTALEGAWALWPIAVLAAAARPLSGHRRLPTLVAVATAAYSVYVGGDAWEWTGHINRYLVCAAPLALILAAIGIEEIAARSRASARPWLPVAAAAAGAIGYTIASIRYFPERELSVARPFLLAAVYACALGAAWTCASRRSFTVLAAAVVVLTASGAKTLEWIRYNDLHVVDDRYATELGVRLRELTTPDARIAVVTAGAVPYYSQRWCLDLLGKNDPYVARLPAHLPLYPGHDKWDYRYSVATWRPDVIVQLWRPSAADVAYVRAAGYVENASGIMARRDSAEVDRERLLTVTEEIERRHTEARAK
jgi:hypothetical protein